MRTATLRTLRRLSLPVLAGLVLALAPGALAQSPLEVAPGQGTLNDAIEGDTNRPADRVYVLQRGAYYGVTREIDTQGYTLRLAAADGEGARPVVHPGIDGTGTPVGSRYFNLGGDTYFTDIYFLAVNPQGGESATSFALNAAGMRLVIDGCVFQAGRSRLIEINVDDTDVFVSNSQFRNMYRESDTSNARPIDYRTVSADSLVVTNTSFLGVNGYLVRYDGPLLNTAIFEHITVFATQRELTTFSFATQVINYRFTNNLIVNGYGEGQAPEDDPMALRDGIVRFDSLDADTDNGFTEADRTGEIRDNGYMISTALQDYYDARTGAGDPLEAYVLVDDGTIAYADSNASVLTLNNNEEYSIEFTSPPDVGPFVQFLADIRDGAPTPTVWYFGEDDGNLFPATQPPPEDMSYPETSPAFTAAQGGLPLGDLNYFPEQLEIYENGGGLSIDTDDGPVEDGFALRPAYPNPASGRTTFRVEVDAPARVSIVIYDALGRSVLATPSEAVAAGSDHRLAVDVSELPAGLYIVRATAETGGDVRTETSRFTVAR